MAEYNDQNNQLPKELKTVFNELEISKHLRNAGIKKKFGFTGTTINKVDCNTIGDQING